MNPLILQASQNLSKLSISLFTGAATYCSFVEHPARLACSTNVAATQFVPSYRRAAIMQASLATIGSISSTVAFWGGDRDPKWIVAAALMFGILPYTLLIMMPINKRLLDPKIDRESTDTKSLLETWGVRHLFRSVASLLALIAIQTN